MNQLKSKIQNHLALMRCPVSHSPLALHGERLTTPKGMTYPLLAKGGVNFLNSAQIEKAEANREFIDQVKAVGKKLLGRYYILLVTIISPVMPRIHWPSMQIYWKWILCRLLTDHPHVIQIGSGSDRIDDSIINVDIFAFPEVDLVADCCRLPYKDNSLDGVISSAVLEHIANPDAALREAFRVLKPGGFILTGVPFLQAYHGSPSDFTRWTTEGLQTWHENHGFNNNEVHVIAGPTSSLAWIVQEWMALVFSLGIRPFYFFWYWIFLVLVCPLKLLDIVLIYHPFAWKLSSFNMCVGYKPNR